MPSEDLFQNFDEHLTISQQWKVDGIHYWQTCEQWLKNLDRNRKQILAIFQRDLDIRKAKIQLQRWRMFFMSCAELFRYREGQEWYVAHYLFEKSKSDLIHPQNILDNQTADLVTTP